MIANDIRKAVDDRFTSEEFIGHLLDELYRRTKRRVIRATSIGSDPNHNHPVAVQYREYVRMKIRAHDMGKRSDYYFDNYRYDGMMFRYRAALAQAKAKRQEVLEFADMVDWSEGST